MREGGNNCLKYLKREWTEKRGGETGILGRRGKLGQGMGALKMGSGTPLRTVLTPPPPTPKLHMTFFCEQIELRVVPNFLNSVSP